MGQPGQVLPASGWVSLLQQVSGLSLLSLVSTAAGQPLVDSGVPHPQGEGRYLLYIVSTTNGVQSVAHRLAVTKYPQ